VLKVHSNPSPILEEILSRQLDWPVLAELGTFWSSWHLLRARPSLPERFRLPAERTSNAFAKAVGQQVQSIVSIAASSSVTSGSEGKSLKAAGT